MGKLTGATHGDDANALMAFYLEKSSELEKAGQYFMAAIALAFGIEASILAYLLVEFGEVNGGELQISDGAGFLDLTKLANQVDVLQAPIYIASHLLDNDEKPKHLAKDVIDKIREFRNLIHPAAALKRQHDPRAFTSDDLAELKEMAKSVTHNLLYHL